MTTIGTFAVYSDGLYDMERTMIDDEMFPGEEYGFFSVKRLLMVSYDDRVHYGNMRFIMLLEFLLNIKKN